MGMQNLLVFSIIYVAVILVTSWLAMVIWAYRDMRARTRDWGMLFILTGIVLILNLPGLLIYLFLRPRETLTEAYEHSLEEEALLQEIEGRIKCPGCSQRVEGDWQACAECHTRLKNPCVRCNRLLAPSWKLCPYCLAVQQEHAELEYTPRRQPRDTAERQNVTWGITDIEQDLSSS